MRQEIKEHIDLIEERIKFIYDNKPPILLADLEAIVYVLLKIVLCMLRRELKRLA